MSRIINMVLLVAAFSNTGYAQTAVASFTASGHGFVQSVNSEEPPVYLTARNAEDGTSIGTSDIRVGQYLSGGVFGIYRTFLCFPLKALSKKTVYACTLYVNGYMDQSATDFDLIVVDASAYKSTMDTADFSHFSGWAASGAYSITALNDSISSADYSADWNAIIFNASGLAAVQSALNDTLWIAILSSRDVSATEPSGIEYVNYDSPSDTNKPYLSIEYAADVPKNAEVGSRYLWNNGDPVPIWR